MRIALVVAGLSAAALLYLGFAAIGYEDPAESAGTVSGYERKLARRVLGRIWKWLVSVALVSLVAAALMTKFT